MRLLLIEDDVLLSETLASQLRQAYIVDVAPTGQDGIANAKTSEYNLILLDLGLPDLSGEEVCRTLRRMGITTPILVLTAEGAVENKINLLDSGADDYLTKPFSFEELRARIRALLRRNPDTLPPVVLTVGDLVLNTSTRSVERDGKPIQLRRKEYDVLECLMRSAGKIVSRDAIMEQAWDTGAELFTNTVDVHIKHLRDKVDRGFTYPLIKTVHGLGYKIEA